MLYVSVINTFEDFRLVFDLFKIGVFLKNSSPISPQFFAKDFWKYLDIFYNLEVYFMENNFRENKADILKEWLDFREDTELAYLTEEDKKHYIQFDEISERILKNVPKQNQKYVKKQLELLDKNFLDYVCYYNEKYYRNGFVDGVQIIIGCLGN